MMNEDVRAKGICDKCHKEYLYEYGCVCQNDLKRVEKNYHQAKHDEGKARFDLIDPIFEEDLAKVMTHGALQYGEGTWATVPNATARYHGAIRRHLNAIKKGELIDPDSNLPHIAHVSANAMFLSYLLRDNE